MSKDVMMIAVLVLVVPHIAAFIVWYAEDKIVALLLEHSLFCERPATWVSYLGSVFVTLLVGYIVICAVLYGAARVQLGEPCSSHHWQSGDASDLPIFDLEAYLADVSHERWRQQARQKFAGLKTAITATPVANKKRRQGRRFRAKLSAQRDLFEIDPSC